MKAPGAQAFWVVFRVFSISLKHFFKITKSKDEVQKDKHRWNFEGKKVKNKDAVSENVVRVATSPRSP